MSEVNVKIQSLIESQIPEFINSESPLFREFLEQYYISQEYETGSVDLIANLNEYKKIDHFRNETFYSQDNPCTLTSDIFYFSDTIEVNSTKGFPKKYGLIKIDDEIITYTDLTDTSFIGCIRGFSGIENPEELEVLNFTTTEAADHSNESVVKNLSLDFFNILFKKFKTQFLPGFEDRDFSTDINLRNILFKARDFYTSKGTDVAFRILFDILYSEQVKVFYPKDYTLSPSDSEYFITNNILVEQIVRTPQSQILNYSNIEGLRGKNIFQQINNSEEISAAVFNIEYRPFENLNLYEISLDNDSVTSKFIPTKKVKNIENISIGDTEISVDSTIGFPKSGSLLIKTDNLTYPIEVTYQDKTITQFLGVSGIIDTVRFGTDIVEDNLLYIFNDDGNILEFRLINIIDSIDFSKSSNLRVGDKIALSTFGVNLNDNIKFNTWLYNLSISHDIRTISTDQSYLKIYLYNEEVKFYANDRVLLLNTEDQSDTKEVYVYDFDEDSNGFYIRTDYVSNYQNYKKLKRQISKGSSVNNYFPNASKVFSGIQNTYIDSEENNLYVASSGLPNYDIFATDNRVYVSTNTQSGDTIYAPSHNFLTGEKIFYISSYSTEDQETRIKNAAYYVYKVDDNYIKLALSHSDIIIQKFVLYTNKIDSNVDYIVKFGVENRSLEDQKILKKINLLPLNNNSTSKSTNDRSVCMLLDGVELNSPTLYDENVYYGKVETIIIDNPGSGYDVINFSGMEVTDDNGSNCKINAQLSGTVREVKVISPGVGYQSKPKITITGGNGSGAILEPNLVKTNIISSFKADLTGLDFGDNSITFLNNHNFNNGESIIYNSNGNDEIQPFKNDSFYYARKISNTKITLHNTKNDAINGIDPIILGSISPGIHSFKTSNLKNTITSVYVKNPGEGYSNAKVAVPSVLTINNQTNGVNTYNDYILAKNHGFNTGDIVEYSTTDYPISGLSTTKNYCLKVLDSDKFKLAECGIGTESITTNLEKNIYANLSGIGTGTHTFKYPDIQINVESLSEIESSEISQPILKLIVLGEINNIFIEDNGSNYGSSDIINFHRRPLVEIKKNTSEALVKPVIYEGKIISTQILNKGRNYNQDIDIFINGKGKYAELDPVIVNGRLENINVINGGIGYDEKTEIIITKRGSGAKFVANVTEWKINQAKKNEFLFSSIEDGLIIASKNIDFGLKYTGFYPSKKIRYILSDNISENGDELTPSRFNVILGWAYDGNPIFGPYSRFGSEIRRVKSSYRLINDEESNFLTSNNLRPKVSDYAEGFFIQDYIYDKDTTEGDLDEYNGMFINDPKLPGISYGYFSTLNEYNVPAYPYVVGKEYKDYLNYENFEVSFNQNIGLENLGLIRNIGPYFIDSFGSNYDELNKVDEKYKQEFVVKTIKSSGIDDLIVYDSGNNYKVGDLVVFDNNESGGNGASAEISRIKGKSIDLLSVGISTFKKSTFSKNGNKIKINTKIPHNLSNNEEVLISSISDKTKSNISGFRKISVLEKTTNLINDVDPESVTGITTFINVSDVSGFRVDDYIKINSETLKIIKINENESRLYVNRSEGIASTHFSSTSEVNLLPNYFLIDDDEYGINNRENATTYFSPYDSVGIGTSGTNYFNSVTVLEEDGILTGTTLDTRNYIGIATASIILGDYVYGNNISAGTTVTEVGIGSIKVSPLVELTSGISTETIRIERPVFEKFVPARGIYIKNHNYYTGQELIYNSGIGGTGLYVEDDFNGVGPFQLNDDQTVYAVNLGINIVGLSTIGFTSTSGIGTQINSLIINSPTTTIGYSHSLRTAYPEITGKVESYFLDASTEESHGLQTNDNIKLTVGVNPTKSLTIRFDTNLRKITTGLIEFDSSEIDTVLNEIPIAYQDLDTGDKVVYYDNNDPISGLENNKVYYILRENPDTIKLCDNFYNSSVGIAISLPSVGIGTQYLSLISPPVRLSSGDILSISLDDSLYDPDTSKLLFDFKLYYDNEFKSEIERFKYYSDDKNITINTSQYDFGSEIYYNLVPISNSIDPDFTILNSDLEVLGSNKIKIQKNILNDYFPIVSTGSSTFKINLKVKPEEKVYQNSNLLDSVLYTTDSKNVLGPIDKIKVNFGGLSYKKLPKIVSIASTLGENAIIRPTSETIGKIIDLERVKDGFDYPTDVTLKPILSSPSVIGIKDISRVDYVGILTGGSGYKFPPQLKVIGNDRINLTCEIDGGSVSNVNIIENVSNLTSSLEIVSLRNSNGIEIDFIEVNGTEVTLELINSDVVLYPLIATGVGSSISEFPFAVGDKIFVENCRKIAEEADQITDSFNSKDYNYAFFTLTSVDEDNYTVTYDMAEVKSDFNGALLSGEANYSTDFGYGYLVNKKNMPQFKMNIIDDLSYLSGESVSSTDFNGIVMDDGWDNDINQLRVKDSKGTLRRGEKLKGEYSGLNGTVESVNGFNLVSSIGPSRKKANENIRRSGILNDYQQRLSDNDYYQNFSYALKSTVPYSKWRDSVLSLAHPSGFKEFSELDIISKPSGNLGPTVKQNDLFLVIKVDNNISLDKKSNFAMVSEEDDNYFEGSIDRITFGAERANVSGIGITGPIIGIPLRPYTLCKTNKVLSIDDIDSQFDGSNEFFIIGDKIIQINSLEPYKLGISTSNLQIGDYVGVSTYLKDNTRIVAISEDEITIDKPHELSIYFNSQEDADILNTVPDNYGFDFTFDSLITMDIESLTYDIN